jgi:RimJ/RimL family protein N-acetyltransferase
VLQGKKISLRIAEAEDAGTLATWFNEPTFNGVYQHFPAQTPKTQVERRIREHTQYNAEWVDFMVVRPDGEQVGWAAHYTAAPNFGWVELGIAIRAEHRNKGYASEAVALLTDYLFLSREINRLQAVADNGNLASIRIFEKAGFRKEGVLRKSLWNRQGLWGDGLLLGILREEWKEPRLLSD